MTAQAPSKRTRVRTKPDRARYDRDVLYAILDEALLCHIAFAVDGQPYAIPTTYGRSGDYLYLHGSSVSRLLRTLAGGVPMCVTVTLLDGLVLARSARMHSMNYRSVVVLGTATAVIDRDERLTALRAIIDHALPGRWREVRPPTDRELNETAIVRVPLDEASAKMRRGPGLDLKADLAQPCWAGVVPLALTAQAPVPDARLTDGIRLPDAIARYKRPSLAS
jgi:nitroimidazol reductase NimA-like FMN-containing flavoprotein (pyridoxamine 5'-phosphate oxidase superfamily)